MSIDTTIDDTTMREWAQGVAGVVQSVIAEANDEIVLLMRRRVRVRTGYTRSTIRREGDAVIADGGAVFLELGTRKMRPRPFMLPAHMEVAPKVPSRIAQALERGSSAR